MVSLIVLGLSATSFSRFAFRILKIILYQNLNKPSKRLGFELSLKVYLRSQCFDLIVPKYQVGHLISG